MTDLPVPPTHRPEDAVDAVLAGIPEQFRLLAVIRLLEMNPVIRMMIAENLGERAIVLHQAEDDETSWDDVALSMLEELRSTPGGRGEVA